MEERQLIIRIFGICHLINLEPVIHQLKTRHQAALAFHHLDR